MVFYFTIKLLLILILDAIIKISSLYFVKYLDKPLVKVNLFFDSFEYLLFFKKYFVLFLGKHI